jgi:hypothetical protein
VCIAVNRNYSVGTWDTLAASVSNTGSWSWPVTGPSIAARTRVSGVSQPSVLDVSDANFSIVQTSVAVTSPNGGETWYTGENHNITWTSVGTLGSVKIELNRSYPGSSWESLFAGTANDGTEPWPVVGPVSSTARIRLTSSSQPGVFDVSDANFGMIAPAPKVVINVQDSMIVLNWSPTGAPLFNVYADSTGFGSFGLFVGSTPDTFMTISTVAAAKKLWFYRATSVTP